MVSVIAGANWIGPVLDYCTGLLPPAERKSEPLAALIDPQHTAPKHQSLLHFVANAP